MKKTLILIAIIIMAYKISLMCQPAFEPSLVSETKFSKEPNRFFSENGEFCGLVEYGTGNTEFIPITRLILQNKNGEIIYEKNNFSHTLVDIANNGAIVGIDFDGPISGRAILNFYDTKGVKLATTPVGFLLERCFSAESNIYCVNDGVNGLRVFRLNGQELYNLGKCNWFAVSRDGKMIALAQDTEIILFEHGNKVGKIPVSSPFIRQIKFSADGSLLSYIDRKNIYLNSVQESKMIFHYQEQNPKFNLISFDIAPDNSAIILGLAEDKGRGVPNRHTRGFVYLFDTNGKLQWKEEIKYSKWNVFVPEVSFTSNCSFKVITIYDIYEYQY